MNRPAPILLAGAAGAAALFVPLTAVVVLHPDALAGVDTAATGLVAPYRSHWLLAAFLWLTTLGTGAALLGVALTATGFLWADRRERLILPLWMAFVGAQASVWAAKEMVARPRPTFLAGVATAASPSFPSAHATGTAATLGFIAYAVARDLPGGWRHRFAVPLGTAILVGLIDLSRVFLGVHYATDVLGGFLLGLAWLFAGIALAERARALPARASRPLP